jgi:hypothetical protein
MPVASAEQLDKVRMLSERACGDTVVAFPLLLVCVFVRRPLLNKRQ